MLIFHYTISCKWAVRSFRSSLYRKKFLSSQPRGHYLKIHRSTEIGYIQGYAIRQVDALQHTGLEYNCNFDGQFDM